MDYYSRQQIEDALQCAIAGDPGPVIRPFSQRFWERLTGEKEPLFTKAELLEKADGDPGRVKIHGLFGFLGVDAATEKDLAKAALQAGFSSSTNRVLFKAKKSREPEWQPGDVVRDANGKYWKHTISRRWASFDSTIYQDNDIPRRPLEKMP